MQVSFGPPGHKGVSHLMAVGADELPPSSTDTALRLGGAVALALALLGRGRARDVGLGGAVLAGGILVAQRLWPQRVVAVP